MNNNEISVRAQCILLQVNRSGLYLVRSQEATKDKALNTTLMRLIDCIFEKHPYYGTRRMKVSLKKLGYKVSRKRVKRLMRKMRLMPIYPKPNLSKRNQEHKVYPYLLRNLSIEKVHQVWATDITYIPMKSGHVYLSAVIDWYSRKILSWKISTGLDASFCIETLNEALEKNGTPEIFNTDQGCQYTSKDFIKVLKKNKIKISMDGKGRALDNVIIERFWGSLKREKIYINEFETIKDLKKGIQEYIDFYNEKRPHQSLGYLCPSNFFDLHKERVAA